ncbi:MAG: hypothetical protein RR482_10350 [Clostridia bacterium]
MGGRLELHEVLKEALGADHVYFQPPGTIKMSYPCVVYARAPDNTGYADNRVYRRKRRYVLTVIDKNPDSKIPDRMAELPMCALDRCYTADNLNHYTFTIYF